VDVVIFNGDEQSGRKNMFLDLWMFLKTSWVFLLTNPTQSRQGRPDNLSPRQMEK